MFNSNLSEAMRRYWANLSPVERGERFKSNSFFNRDLLTQEERQEREQMDIENLEKGKARMSDEEKEERSRKAGESISAQIKSLTSEEQEERLRKSFLSEEAIKKSRKSQLLYWASLTPKEKDERLARSFHSPEAKKKAQDSLSDPRLRSQIGESVMRYWAGRSEEEMEEFRKKCSCSGEAAWEDLSEEEKELWVKRSFLSDEAIRKSIEARQVRPSEPEFWLGMYLEKNFPGEWTYNGDYSQGIRIGGRMPDFVNINGKKQVIEELGVFWHPEEDEQKKVDHYKKYGFDCIVIWQYDCYLWSELDKIFKGQELTS